MLKSFARYISNLNTGKTVENVDTNKIFALVHNGTDGFKTPEKTQKHSIISVGVPRRSPQKALVALICALTVGVSAAAYYFAGAGNVLTEQEADEQIQAAETDTPAPEDVVEVGVEKVDKPEPAMEEIATLKGVEVTLRGVVGAEDALRIFIDVEDLSGRPLTLYNEDGSLPVAVPKYRQDLNISKIKIRADETLDYVDPYWEKRESGNYGDTFSLGYYCDIVLAPTDAEGMYYDACPIYVLPNYNTEVEVIRGNALNKVTLLITVPLTPWYIGYTYNPMEEVNLEDFLGQTLYITIADIMQWTKLNDIDTGADLYAIVSEFNDVTDDDFVQTGAGGDIPTYKLISDSGREIPLSDNPDYSDYTVTNAAFRDGILYLRGEIKSGEAEFFRFLVINKETGEVLTTSNFEEFDETDNVLRWFCNIADTFLLEGLKEGISSVEDLKNYALIDRPNGSGRENKTLVEGEWDFEVPLTVDSLFVKHDIGEKFTIGGFELTADYIDVSPYSIMLYATPDRENGTKMNNREDMIRSEVLYPGFILDVGETDWEKYLSSEEPAAAITMKDGSKIVTKLRIYDDGDGFVVKFIVVPDVVIDPEEIAYFEVGSLRFEF